MVQKTTITKPRQPLFGWFPSYDSRTVPGGRRHASAGLSVPSLLANNHSLGDHQPLLKLANKRCR